MVDEADMLDLFRWELHDAFRFGRLSGIPEGARVLSVHHRFECRAFAFIVEHPSFDLVQPRSQIPVHPDPLAFSYRALIKQSDGRYQLSE